MQIVKIDVSITHENLEVPVRKSAWVPSGTSIEDVQDTIVERMASLELSGKLTIEVSEEKIEVSDSATAVCNLVIDEIVRHGEVIAVLDLGAVPDPADARFNTIERDLRSQGNRIEKLTSSISQLVNLVKSIASSEPQPSQESDSVVDDAAEASPAPSPVRPHVGRQGGGSSPVASMDSKVPSRSDASAPVGRASRNGGGITHEMAHDGMRLIGPAATGKILVTTIGPDGKKIVEEQKFSKIGDSLRPLSARSDIKPT